MAIPVRLFLLVTLMSTVHVCQSQVTGDTGSGDEHDSSHRRQEQPVSTTSWNKNTSIESNTNTTQEAMNKTSKTNTKETSTISPKKQKSGYWTRVCLITDSFVAFTVGPLGLLGVVGNMINMVVLVKIRNKMSGWLFLLLLAICDSGFLILNFILKTLPVIAVTYLRVPNFYNWFVYVIVYGWNGVTVFYSTGRKFISSSRK